MSYSHIHYFQVKWHHWLFIIPAFVMLVGNLLFRRGLKRDEGGFAHRLYKAVWSGDVDVDSFNDDGVPYPYLCADLGDNLDLRFFISPTEWDNFVYTWSREGFTGQPAGAVGHHGVPRGGRCLQGEEWRVPLPEG